MIVYWLVYTCGFILVTSSNTIGKTEASVAPAFRHSSAVSQLGWIERNQDEEFEVCYEPGCLDAGT